jgi:hypothetical protein
MRSCLVVLAALLLVRPAFAQNAPASDEASILAFAQNAVVRALDYKQGDRDSLIDAKDDFTASGWSEFMKRMDGWLDAAGAPLSSEDFKPSGPAVVKTRENGVIRVELPGTLTQTQNKSTTTYRVTVEGRLAGKPLRIEHLEPITAAGATRRNPGASAPGVQWLTFTGASLCYRDSSLTCVSSVWFFPLL